MQTPILYPYQRRYPDYFGPIDFSQSLMLTTPEGSVLKADVFKAREDRRAPWRLAFSYGDGRFEGMAGKYGYFKTKRDLMTHWKALGAGEVAP